MRRNKILYSLNVEDFQNVALNELGRVLTDQELNQVADYVADHISWYDLITESIAEFHACDDGSLAIGYIRPTDND